ncbi:MAG: DNA-binding response regulator [Burkholderiales bacterium]|nr:DNA-binding response regulator [Phycisphaerae bacterium]
MTPSVLIIEDEPRLREVLSEALRSWGMTSTTARSGEEALRSIDNHPADILLMDLNLPGISGIETLAELRRRGIDAPAIILTGFGDLQAAQDAIKLNVVAFLTKPAPLGELEKAIDRARKQLKPDLPIRVPEQTSGAKPVKLEELEREHIVAVLKKNNGNRTLTAKELGISRRTLQYRLSEYQEKGWVEAE